MIEEAIHAYLSQQDTVVAIAGDRIYPEMKPEDRDYPCITYSRERTQRDLILEGQSALVKTEMQVDAWAEDYKPAKLLQRAIQASLRNQSLITMGGLFVDKVYLEDVEADVYESQIDRYRSSQIYSFWYCEL